MTQKKLSVAVTGLVFSLCLIASLFITAYGIYLVYKPLGWILGGLLMTWVVYQNLKEYREVQKEKRGEKINDSFNRKN